MPLSTPSLLTSLYLNGKRLVGLQFENIRLKTTEKITILLSAIAFYAVAMAMGLVCLVFISIGLGHLLATTIAPHLAYLLIALFYLFLFIMVFVLKRQLFIDPIARFMSRLLVEVPEEERIAPQTGTLESQTSKTASHDEKP